MRDPEPSFPVGLSSGIKPGSSRSLTAEAITEVCTFLRRQHAPLATMGVSGRIEALAAWTRRWLSSKDPFRTRAEQQLEAELGCSLPVIRWGLDALFEAWTAPAMIELLTTELGTPDVLTPPSGRVPRAITERTEAAAPHGLEYPGGRWAMAPQLTAHVLAGNLPQPTLQSLMATLLVGSPSFLKASSRAPCFPHLLAASLAPVSPILRDAVACACWSREDSTLSDALFAAADDLVAFGDEDSLRSVAAQIPPRLRLHARGHRLSLTYLARESLTKTRLKELTEACALDVAIFEQEGCLSPHAILIETGGEISPEVFARQLALEAMPTIAGVYPRGRTDLVVAAAAMQLRGVQAFVAEVLETPDGTVVFTHSEHFEPSCLGRVVFIRPVENIEEALRWSKTAHPHLQAIALASGPARATSLAEHWLRVGASRLCAPGQLQRPPAGWGGDGQPVLAGLLRWGALDPDFSIAMGVKPSKSHDNSC